MTWSNAFSYGSNNAIDFTKSPLTQLVGKNGHGKSSIALILEEVLFNKNSKGIKKGDIINRHIKDKTYTIDLDFEVDGNAYRIECKRGSTQQVKLLKNGVDISGHTATNTYKQIEAIIGMDHKTFSQVVYQSHSGSLEFLTSPDTARKKFLIEILNLGKYTQAGEVFKQAAADVAKEVAAAEAKVSTINQWIAKYNKLDFTMLEELEVPEVPDDKVKEAASIEAKLTTLEQENKRIAQNNTYKVLQSKIKLLPAPEKPEEIAEPFLKVQAAAAQRYASAKALRDKLTKLHGQC
ncbi:MAG: AAA family ATPase, partial [Burkholderiales bacterium]